VSCEEDGAELRAQGKKQCIEVSPFEGGQGDVFCSGQRAQGAGLRAQGAGLRAQGSGRHGTWNIKLDKV
jgi:hypothetical protein